MDTHIFDATVAAYPSATVCASQLNEYACAASVYVYVCVSAYNAYAENLSHESRRSGKGDPSGCEILWQRKYYTTTTRVGIYCAFFP